MLLRISKIILLIVLLAACSGQDTTSEDASTPTAITPTSTPIIQPSAIPTTESTPSNMQNLVVWWPDALSPSDRSEVADLINEQIREFSVSENDLVNVDFRLKRYSDVGGIISTLRAASGVAPGAIPDVTLIRREDLISAVQSGLVYPLEGLISFGVISDMYDPALELGQFNGQLYGLPYMLDVQITAYRAEETRTDWTFDAVLGYDVPLVFPARRVNGVNRQFFIQYLAAGGTPPTADGTLMMNQTALSKVLEFYENAYELGIIPEEVANYSSISDYLPAFILEEINMATITTTTYFDLQASGDLLQIASIPTLDGDSTGALNGWMWVITTPNVEQQELAASFINWMMDIQRQRDFGGGVHMLPSQRTALQGLDDDMVDISSLDMIVSGSVPPLSDLLNGSVARTLQNAFISVITGESTADEATEAVMDQLSTN